MGGLNHSSLGGYTLKRFYLNKNIKEDVLKKIHSVQYFFEFLYNLLASMLYLIFINKIPIFYIN